MLKIAHLDDAFLEVFCPQASPVEGQSLQQKEEKRRKRKGEKKIPKIEKPKDVGQNFDFCPCPSHNALKRDAGGNKASCCVANAFSTGLKVIWPRSGLKMTKMSKKKHFLQKVQGVNGLIIDKVRRTAKS